MSQFRSDVKQKGWWFYDRDHRTGEKQITHTLMNFGNLSVDDQSAFHEVYSQAVVRGEPVYVVCRKTFPIYRMFFDIDCCLYVAPGDVNAFYEKVSKLVCATIFELFSNQLGAPLRSIVSVAEPKTIKKSSKDVVKIGVHINVPELHVNKEMALRVRMAVVQKLENNFEKAGPTSWDDDVDHVVYQESGLRMLFSRKARKCSCPSSKRDECGRCHGVGFIDEGRPYLPSFEMFAGNPVESGEVECFAPIYYDDAAITSSLASILTFVRDTCIRSERTTPNLEFNSSAPSWFEDPFAVEEQFADGGELGVDLQALPGGSRKKRRLTEGVDAVEGHLENKVKLPSCDEVAINTWLETQVRKKVLPREYKKTTIASAFSFTTNSIRSHAICRLNSQFCCNIGREHATNTVYLELNLVTQKASIKCYCRCNTLEGRRPDGKGKKVLCKDYRSTPIDINDLKLSIQCVSRPSGARPKLLAIL